MCGRRHISEFCATYVIIDIIEIGVDDIEIFIFNIIHSKFILSLLLNIICIINDILFVLIVNHVKKQEP